MFKIIISLAHKENIWSREDLVLKRRKCIRCITLKTPATSITKHNIWYDSVLTCVQTPVTLSRVVDTRQENTWWREALVLVEKELWPGVLCNMAPGQKFFWTNLRASSQSTLHDYSLLQHKVLSPSHVLFSCV